MLQISGHIVDISNRNIYSGSIFVDQGHITGIKKHSVSPSSPYLMPGFIDAHIHIESSMISPCEFARMAVVHGTVGAVCDPHEIANVLGIEGVKFMSENGEKTNFHFCFGAPSCVPATSFESSGAHLLPSDIHKLFEEKHAYFLAEMMNFPGVIQKDPEVMEKIRIAQSFGLPIDGHAPGLTTKEVKQYALSGISTDHECMQLSEAVEKIGYGMKILIREGSAAKNFDNLVELLDLHPESVMFCSDDKHPNDLAVSHINALVKRALKKGYRLFDVLSAASLHPILHYNLPVGRLRLDDSADFIVINNLTDFDVLQTYIHGVLVAEQGQSMLPHIPTEPINHFNTSPISFHELLLPMPKNKPNCKIRVIEAMNKELWTKQMETNPKVIDDCAVSDPEKDILKIVVKNRYNTTPAAVAFIHGFGMKEGAIASSVAHDSHNIVAVGTNDHDLLTAINALIEKQGGLALSNGENQQILPLPIAGLMSNKDGLEVASAYEKIHQAALELGCTMDDPFMTLAFMSLLVIPELKLSDKGLFDGKRFTFTDVFVF